MSSFYDYTGADMTSDPVPKKLEGKTLVQAIGWIGGSLAPFYRAELVIALFGSRAYVMKSRFSEPASSFPDGSPDKIIAYIPNLQQDTVDHVELPVNDPVKRMLAAEAVIAQEVEQRKAQVITRDDAKQMLAAEGIKLKEDE